MTTVSTRIMSLCWPLQMDLTSKAVLISLADNANDEGECWPKIETISQRTCACERAVKYAIQRLKEMGLLEIQNRADGARSRYRITLESYQQACDARAPNAPSTCTKDTSKGQEMPPRILSNNRQLTVNEPGGSAQRREDGHPAPAVSNPYLNPSQTQKLLAERDAGAAPQPAEVRQRMVDLRQALRGQL